MADREREREREREAIATVLLNYNNFAVRTTCKFELSCLPFNALSHLISVKVFGELESSSHHQVISETRGRGVALEAEGGVALGAEGQAADRLEATRSLLRGKVSTTTLEVREREGPLVRLAS